MDVVKPNAPVSVPAGTGGESETPSQSEPQQTDQTAVEPGEPSIEQKTQEKTVPYSRFAEQNKQFRETQRRLAELESKGKLQQYDPNDMDKVMAHPVVQELMLKNAKHDLNDYAKDLLEQYPTIHPQVKKAILANVRGWVKETTTDVESAKIDIAEMVEGLVADSGPTPPQPFQVAQTNAGAIKPGVKPAEVAKILQKPMDEIGEEDAKVLKNYRRN